MEEGGIPSPSVASNSVASPTADSPGLSKCFRAKSWVSAAISDASPSSPVGDPTAHHAEVLKHRVRVASLPVERGSSGTSSRGSSKAKIEEFTLHMTLERLRAFYGVLRLGLYMFASGVLLTVLAELLWRLLPPGRLAEWLISALSIVSWLLTALTVAVASTCPMEELDIASFIDSRPGLCFFMALPPALTAATRVVELPIPRILSVITVLGLVCRGCFGLLRRCQSLPLPTSVVLMELWCLDVMVSSSISGMARAGIPGITEIILGMFAAFGSALIVMLWVVRAASTIRFYVSTHLATGYSGFYFACRAYDLATGTKQWDEGRQVDIAIAAAVGMATVTLVPQILVVLVGRRRLFQVLRNKVEQSRNRQLQSGAFMAMLLDSYFVQKGQPWWLQRDSPELEADAETTNINNKPQQFHYAAGIDSKLSVSMESLATPPSLMPEMDMESRPDFVRAKVAQVSQDGSVFWVQPEFSNQSIRVDRKQQVIPWPQLLEVGRKNLRCIDWKKQYGELWTENAGAAGFKLSRPVGRGETIDFFVSHSWSDSGIRKFRALSYVAEEFYVRQGRHPTFWVDKFCIDQTSVEDGLRVLPVNVMACSKVLVLCGNTYPSRLWCAWELCVLLSFMSLQTALTRLVVFPFSHIALQKLARFDLMNARCYDPNEELRLRRVISAIGQLSFENKIQALGQLILDRETGLASGLLMQGGSGSWSDTDPEVEEDRSALPDLEVVDEASMEDCTSSLCPSPAGDAFLRQLEQGDYQRQLEAPLEEVAF